MGHKSIITIVSINLNFHGLTKLRGERNTVEIMAIRTMIYRCNIK